MENKNQTPVEWLVNELTNLGYNFKLYKKEINHAKEMEKQNTDNKFTEEDVELITNEMVNWAIDNIGNPDPKSGKKFDEVIGKYKNKEKHELFCKCGSTKFNTTTPEKPFCFLCGEDVGPKNETLEEAGEKESEVQGWGKYEGLSEQYAIKQAFINGVKWVKENSGEITDKELEFLIRTTYEETMRAMLDWFINNKDKNREESESAIEEYIYPRLAEKGIIFKK